MKKYFLTTAFVILTSALSAAAVADDSLYIGLNAGQSYFKDASGGMNSSAGILTANCGTCSYHLDMSNRELGYQGFVGYRFNEYFALEGGYANFGKAVGTATGPYVPGFPFTPSNSGTVHSEMKAYGVTFDAMLSYPLTQKFLVFGKLGIIAARGANSFVDSGSIGNGSGTASGSGTKQSYGVGVTYAATKRWSVRSTWQQFHDIPAVGDVNFLSLGVTYSF